MWNFLADSLSIFLRLRLTNSLAQAVNQFNTRSTVSTGFVRVEVVPDGRLNCRQGLSYPGFHIWLPQSTPSPKSIRIPRCYVSELVVRVTRCSHASGCSYQQVASYLTTELGFGRTIVIRVQKLTTGSEKTHTAGYGIGSSSSSDIFFTQFTSLQEFRVLLLDGSATSGRPLQLNRHKQAQHDSDVGKSKLKRYEMNND